MLPRAGWTVSNVRSGEFEETHNTYLDTLVNEDEIEASDAWFGDMQTTFIPVFDEVVDSTVMDGQVKLTRLLQKSIHVVPRRLP